MSGKNYVAMDRFNRIQEASLQIEDKNYSVYRGINTIGRNKVATVNVKHLNVSQNQAVIVVVDDTQHFISDLNSSNGTFLHGSKLNPFKLYEISNSSEVKFGDIVGKYSKISNMNSTVNLQFEPMEMTQNTTQNFYAANTQLVFNDSVINSTEQNSRTEIRADDIPIDIHEMATQVVEFPQRFLSNNTSSATRVDNQEIIKDKIDMEFHNAATQVVTFEQFHDPEEASHMGNEDKTGEENDKKATSVTEDEIKLLEQQNQDKPLVNKKVTIHSSQIPSTSGIKNIVEFGSNDTSFNAPKNYFGEGVIEETVIEDSLREDALDGTSNDSIDFLMMQMDVDKSKNEEKMIDKNNQENVPNYEEIENPKNELLKAKMSDESCPNDPTSNSSSQTDVIGKPKRKPVPKLPSEKSSQDDKETHDSLETEPYVQHTLDKETLKNTCIKKLATDSDSDTDIEGTQEIGPRKKRLQKLNSEEEDIPVLSEVNKSNQDSDTDCEEDLIQRGEPPNANINRTEDIPLSPPDHFKSVQEPIKSDINSGSDTDVEEIEKSNAPLNDDDKLNDTDCIPPTQDAFAQAFSYKTSSKDGNQSSEEESFKLGLTELMDESEGDKTEPVSTNERENENSDTIKNNCLPNEVETEKEDIFIMPTQEIISSKDPTFAECIDNEKVSSMETQNLDNKDDEIYLMPTQCMGKTQETESEFKVPFKKFNFKKKAPSLRESLTTILSDKNDEDIYMAATQKINEYETMTHDKDNQSVQKLSCIEESGENEFYFQPTQCINSEVEDFAGFSKTTKKDKEDIYMAATQQIDEEISEIHGKPTQCINSEVGDFAGLSKTTRRDKEDIYLAATQQIDEESSKIHDNKSHDEILENTCMKSTQEKIEDISDHIKNVTKLQEIYCQETQPLQYSGDENDQRNASKTNHPATDSNENNPNTNLYDLVTQPIIEDTSNISKNATKTTTLATDSNPKDVKCQETKPCQDLVNKNIENNTRNSTPSGDSNRNDIYDQQTQIYDHPGDKINQNTEKISILSTNPNINLYDLSTQPVIEDNNSGIKNAECIQIQSEKQSSKLLNEDSVIVVGTSSTSGKRIQSTRPNTEALDVPKSKRLKKSHIESLVKTVESDENDHVETLSQIEAFIKKPLKIVVPKIRIPTHKEECKKEGTIKEPERAETMSQIEEFIQRPIIRSVDKEECKNESAKESDKPEKLDLIESVIKKPLSETDKFPKVDPSAAGRNENDLIKKKIVKRKSRILIEKTTSSSSVENGNDDNRVSKRSSRRQADKELKKDIKINIQKITEENVDIENGDKIPKGKQKSTLSNAMIEIDAANDTNSKAPVQQLTSHLPNDQIKECFADTSRDPEAVKSDVDQSFALLESKTSKAKRNPRKQSILDDIKVTVTSHRRSMITAETSKVDSLKLPVPSRKSRRVTVNNNSLPSNTRQRTKRVSRVKNKLSHNSDSDFSDSEVPAKLSKISKETKSENEEIQHNSIREPTSSSISDKTSKINSKKIRVTKSIINQMSSTSEESSNSSDFVLKMNAINMKNFNYSDRMSSTSKDDNTLDEPSTPVKRRTLSNVKNTRGSEDTISLGGGSSASSVSVMTPRRTQRSNQDEVLLNSAERSKRKLKHKVAFTMLDNPQLESLIRQMGGSLVDSVDACTALVTEHVKRSQKLLTAVGQGKPICSPSWIKASKKANEFLDPWDFILSDKEAESKWNFSLKESLTRAVNDKLLSDYTFQIMVTNAADVLKGAIEACGGKCVTRSPSKNMDGNFVIIASPEQKSKYSKIKKQNPSIQVVEPEAIFDGVLRQQLRLSKHLLV